MVVHFKCTTIDCSRETAECVNVVEYIKTVVLVLHRIRKRKRPKIQYFKPVLRYRHHLKKTILDQQESCIELELFSPSLVTFKRSLLI